MNPIKIILYGVILALFCPCKAMGEKMSGNLQGVSDSKELVARLEKYVQGLTIFSAKNKELCDECMDSIESFLTKIDYHKRFSHELTVLSLKAMLFTRNIDLFLKTWDVFVHIYNVVDPQVFLKEYSQIVFMLYSILGSHMEIDARIFYCQDDTIELLDSSDEDMMAMMDDYYQLLCVG